MNICHLIVMFTFSLSQHLLINLHTITMLHKHELQLESLSLFEQLFRDLRVFVGVIRAFCSFVAVEVD